MDREFHVQRDFLSGSYARWTKTKPLKDVDIFCVLGGEDKKYRDKEPSVILTEVSRIMGTEYGAENVTIQTRSVGIAFKNAAEEEVMSFDVVTAFDADKHYEVPDTKSADSRRKPTLKSTRTSLVTSTLLIHPSGRAWFAWSRPGTANTSDP